MNSWLVRCCCCLTSCNEAFPAFIVTNLKGFDSVLCDQVDIHMGYILSWYNIGISSLVSQVLIQLRYQLRSLSLSLKFQKIPENNSLEQQKIKNVVATQGLIGLLRPELMQVTACFIRSRDMTEKGGGYNYIYLSVSTYQWKGELKKRKTPGKENSNKNHYPDKWSVKHEYNLYILWNIRYEY